MGFFSALMNGFSKAVADNLWPVFQQARKMDEHTLRAYIENETVSMRKAVYLLAMNNINPYYSKEIYENSRTEYNNCFDNLKRSYRFEYEVNSFILNMSRY